jgi:hypothetical protein
MVVDTVMRNGYNLEEAWRQGKKSSRWVKSNKIKKHRRG